MSVQLKINDRAFVKSLRHATANGLKRAAVFYHSQNRIALNKPNTLTRRRIRVGPNRGRFAKSVYLNPAPVGQPPHKRTGFGQSNIVWEFNGDLQDPAVRVGVRKNALYLYFHEVGIRGKKRPWMIPTLMKHRAMIARLACTGGGSAGSAPRSGGGGN